MNSRELQSIHEIVEVYENSQALMDIVLDSMPGFFAIVDERGVILEVNKECVEYLGKLENEIIGHTLVSAFGPTAGKVLEKHLDAAKSGPSERVSFDLRLPMPGQGECVILWDVASLEGDFPNCSLYKIVGRDATDFQKRVAEASALSKELELKNKENTRLEVLLRISQLFNREDPAGLLINEIIRLVRTSFGWDAAVFWRWDDSSKTFRIHRMDSNTKLFDKVKALDLQLPMGTGIVSDAWNSGQSACGTGLLNEYLNLYTLVFAEPGPVVSLAIPIRTRKGIQGVLEFLSQDPNHSNPVLIRPMEELSNRVAEFIDWRELQVELREKDQQLVYVSKMSALGEMAGGLAHEINNPLAIIQLMIDSITSAMNEEGDYREKIPKFLSKISSTVHRIAKIIRGLRSFARDSEGDPFVKTNAYTLIDETLAFCEERFKNDGVRFSVSPMDPGLSLECRPAQISQILLNLLNNSFDAIVGLKERWIKVEGREKDNGIELSITDSGAGIPPEVVAKIMQPFFSTKPVGQGTGLGLSISCGIAESHGGKLYVDKDCQNTRFVLWLPKQPKG